jgi:hypothetical protein
VSIKKLLIFIFFIIFSALIPNKISAEIDYFNTLKNLKVGEKLSDDLISQGQLLPGDGQDVKYLFDSISYSNPHFIYTDNDSNITFKMLLIPQEEASSYLNEFKNLGEPEVFLARTEIVFLTASPSYGIGLIHSEENILNQESPTNLKVIYFPPKTVDEFLEKEGESYSVIKVVDDVNEIKIEKAPGFVVPTEYQARIVIEEKTNDTKVGNKNNIIIIFSITLLFLSTTMFVLYIKNKKKPKILTEEVISSKKKPEVKKPELILKIKEQ